MIYELQQEQYEKVRPLFQTLDYHLTPQAVIDGICPGKIYVNDREVPTSAFAFTAEGYFLVGDSNNDAFNTALRNMLSHISDSGEPAWKHENEIRLEMSSQTWKSLVLKLFSDRAPLIERRRKYLCTELRVDWKEWLPAGYTARPVDRDLLEQSGVKIPERVENSRFQIDEWINVNWGTYENFFQHAFGFCLVHEQQVVSWSVADCISGTRCEIGIYTIPEYRQRGLAAITVAATVDYCFSQAFTSVGWHCLDINIGSWRTAEKVGFVKECDYQFYLYMLDKGKKIQ